MSSRPDGSSRLRKSQIRHEIATIRINPAARKTAPLLLLSRPSLREAVKKLKIDYFRR